MKFHFHFILYLLLYLPQSSYSQSPIITSIVPLQGNIGDTIIIKIEDFNSYGDLKLKRKPSGFLSKFVPIKYEQKASLFENNQAKITIVLQEHVNFLEPSTLLFIKSGHQTKEASICLPERSSGHMAQTNKSEMKPTFINVEFKIHPTTIISYKSLNQSNFGLSTVEEIETRLSSAIDDMLKKFGAATKILEVHYPKRIITNRDESSFQTINEAIAKVAKKYNNKPMVIGFPDIENTPLEVLQLVFQVSENIDTTNTPFQTGMKKLTFNSSEKIEEIKTKQYTNLKHLQIEFNESAQDLEIVFSNYEPAYKNNIGIDELMVDLRDFLQALEKHQSLFPDSVQLTTYSFENQEVLSSFSSDIEYTESESIQCKECFVDGKKQAFHFEQPGISILEQEFLKQLFIAKEIWSGKSHFFIHTSSNKEDLECHIKISFKKK